MTLTQIAVSILVGIPIGALLASAFIRWIRCDNCCQKQNTLK